MKYAILLLFLLPFSVNALDLTGYWTIQSSDKDGFIEFRTDGTYVSYLPVRREMAMGTYQVLNDNSGVLFTGLAGSSFPLPLILEVRQANENQIILQAVVIGLVLNKPNPQELVKYKKESAAFIEKYEMQEMQRLKQLEHRTVTFNLRQVASAGQQYILDHGAESVSYAQLVDVYFAPLEPINGESYKDLVVSEKGGTLTVTDQDGEVYEYEY